MRSLSLLVASMVCISFAPAQPTQPAQKERTITQLERGERAYSPPLRESNRIAPVPSLQRDRGNFVIQPEEKVNRILDLPANRNFTESQTGREERPRLPSSGSDRRDTPNQRSGGS